MSALFKILLFSSPVLALIFFYVVSQQAKLDTEMEEQDLQFERAWNEFEADFVKSPVQKRKYEERGAKADEMIRELEKEKAEKKAEAERFKKDFEKAIEDFEKEQAQKNNPRDSQEKRNGKHHER